MSSSTSKKIVRKVFFSTGAALGEVGKIKKGLVDVAKSFQAGYHLLGNEASTPAYKGNGLKLRSLGQQLDGLYGHFGKLIYENLENKCLSYQFKPGYEHLHEKVDGLLNEISPIVAVAKEEIVRNEVSVKEVIPLREEPTESRSEDVMARLKNVVSLSRLNTSESRTAILFYVKDPDSLVRRVIVNCINPEDGPEETFAIVKLINDPDEDVARIAIRKSAKTRNRLAFTYLISRLDSENVKIRKEAMDALMLITGSDLGFNPTASQGARDEAVLRWQQVWQDNQMNPQFLMDDEATRLIVKKKYLVKTVAQELKQSDVIRHSEAKVLKSDTHSSSPKNLKAS